MSSETTSSKSNKAAVRQRVWSHLLQHALPDSRHHFDFSSYITDFQGSSAATDRLVSLECYKSSQLVFITPDNCLEELRYRALKDGKKVLVTTYAIRRGFWLLDPGRIAPEKYELASLLDAMERPGIGKQMNMAQMREDGMKVDLCVTGTGAINTRGVRFGKGHGFFDLEWAMLMSMGMVEKSTAAIAIVHDCQVVDEEKEGIERLVPEPWDTACDYIVTPSKVIEVQGAVQPTCGILWGKLAPDMMETIPPLQELQGIQMAEEIMKAMGDLGDSKGQSHNMPSADELMGVQMVEQLMKGYKA